VAVLVAGHKPKSSRRKTERRRILVGGKISWTAGSNPVMFWKGQPNAGVIDIIVSYDYLCGANREVPI